MSIQALIATRERRFALETFPEPTLAPNQVRVQTLYSGVSVGTEFMVIQGRLDWGPFPVCTGYQATGQVVEVGSEVDRFQTGDVVYYRRNFIEFSLDGQVVNSCAATHASMAVVPQDREIELLPDGVTPDVGSLFVMPAVGYNAVNMAGIRMNDLVVIQGLGLIGTGAMLAARLRGAVVVGIELDETRMRLAHALGIDHLIDGRAADPLTALHELRPEGGDAVFEATGIPRNLDAAFRLCRIFGKFVYLGNLGSAPVTFNFMVPHQKQLTAFFPCNDGLKPCRSAVMRNIASGAMPWGKTISHRVEATEAPALYQAIDEKALPDLTGAVIQWS